MPGKAHTHTEYENELRQVRENLLRMAGLVEEMIGHSVRALMNNNVALAGQTIEDDHKVNRFEVETDELCLQILARRNPMASDLRFITLAMKMVTDLERIGDLAVNICERTIALHELAVEPPSPLIPKMADAAQAMVRQAIDAFIRADTEKANAVFAADAEVDDFYYEIVNSVESGMQAEPDPDRLERGIHIHSVAKFLERIGDHATNLAEMVIFLVKGKDVRHIGKR
jgi:phosphate transport system protein